HRFHHAKIFYERRCGKIYDRAFRVLSLRQRRIHHVAIEPMHPRISTGGDGGGIHHREGRINGVMVCKDDAGSSKRKVVRRNFWSEIVGSKPIPNENDDLPCGWPCVRLLRLEVSCQAEKHEGGASTQANKR